MIELLPIPENELFRPCPFCGKTPKISGSDHFIKLVYGSPRKCGGYYIECEGCECSLGHLGSQEGVDIEFGAFESIGALLSAWNRRDGHDGYEQHQTP